jgi:hypothetical protein
MPGAGGSRAPRCCEWQRVRPRAANPGRTEEGWQQGAGGGGRDGSRAQRRLEIGDADGSNCSPRSQLPIRRWPRATASRCAPVPRPDAALTKRRAQRVSRAHPPQTRAAAAARPRQVYWQNIWKRARRPGLSRKRHSPVHSRNGHHGCVSCCSTGECRFWSRVSAFSRPRDVCVASDTDVRPIRPQNCSSLDAYESSLTSAAARRRETRV